MTTQVKLGDRVQVLCMSKLDDGTWLDDESERNKPMWITAGKSSQLSMINDAVIGMSIGEKKKVVIPPGRAFGERDEKKNRKIALNELPDWVAIGDHLSIEQGDREITGIVKIINETYAILDTNHILAGRTLTVDLQLLAIHR